MTAILDKLKHTKGLWFLLIGLLSGLLLLLIGTEDTAKVEESPTPSQEAVFDETDAYLSLLERRVTQLLNGMDGVSEASVLLIPDTTTETVYGKNETFDHDTVIREEILFSEADGEPFPITFRYPKLRGIAVVCRGGSNPILQEKIVTMLCSLFDLPSTKVYVTG
ncbi:MAG: hypothetical protein E7618_00820 [Ruminococcaceae bacterium]|nr:hypothetical protein [Oscillospiraceae bacterium]